MGEWRGDVSMYLVLLGWEQQQNLAYKRLTPDWSWFTPALWSKCQHLIIGWNKQRKYERMNQMKEPWGFNTISRLCLVQGRVLNRWWWGSHFTSCFLLPVWLWTYSFVFFSGGVCTSHWKTLSVLILRKICELITFSLCFPHWKLARPQSFTRPWLGASSDQSGNNWPSSIGHYKDLDIFKEPLLIPFKVTENGYNPFKQASHQNQVRSICRAFEGIGIRREVTYKD